MNKENPVRKVELPDFETIKGAEMGETICNLYRRLIPEASNKPVGINPSKIRMNYDDCLEYVKLDQEQFERRKVKKVGLMWMNQGPAADKEVPRGKIYLYTGYVAEDKDSNPK